MSSVSVFTMFRPLAEARAAKGACVTLPKEGKWYCVGHNDLGCLYWHPSPDPGPRAKLIADDWLDHLAGFPRRCAA